MSATESAEVMASLREAARMMRGLAEGATSGNWDHLCMGFEGCQVLNDGHLRDRKRVAMFGRKEWKADHADARYVAAMQPAVALAVAAWLEGTAQGIEHDANEDRDGCYCVAEPSAHRAADVAREFLASVLPRACREAS